MSTITKARGISFSAPMVRAIAAGKKSQTRRIMKPQPGIEWGAPPARVYEGFFNRWGCHRDGVSIPCPHSIGDVLYVKEGLESIGGFAAYAADSACVLDEDADVVPWKWKRPKLPGIYMPKRLARHFIEITDIRVERLHEINDGDAKAEGLDGWLSPAFCVGGEIQGPDGQTPVEGFQDLWADINGRDSWDANPWVWVYEFRKVKSWAKHV